MGRNCPRGVRDRANGSAVNVPVLRAHRDPRTPTVLRRLLAELLARAQATSAAVVRCNDFGDGLVESALADVGFVLRDGQYEKWTMRGIVEPAQLPDLLPANDAIATESVERACWPLKLRGANTTSYVVPIRPHWASQLFDAELASRDLFGARLETALALENVYYYRRAASSTPDSRSSSRRLDGRPAQPWCSCIHPRHAADRASSVVRVSGGLHGHRSSTGRRD